MPQALPAPSSMFVDPLFQFALTLGGALVLVLALVYLFPDHSGADPWRPEAVIPLVGP